MAAKKKITKLQRFALQCYVKSIKSYFTKSVIAKIRNDAKNIKYEDEFDAIKGYMLAKAQEEISKQIVEFFKALLEALI